MLKVELHAHSIDDPVDLIPHTTFQLIARAADLGYQALAVTLHDRQLRLSPFADYAKERGVVLIPGIERTIEGKHVLLLNFRSGTEEVRSFADLAKLRAREPGLVVAPHPFFPSSLALNGKLLRHPELFDAVEYNGMFTPWVNFNRRAERWARANGKPVVGNGDVHRLQQLGTTWSNVDAEPDPTAICEAIKAGRVEFEAHPHTAMFAGRMMSDLFAAEMRKKYGVRLPLPRAAWDRV